MKTVKQTVKDAEQLLPGAPALEDKPDLRWKAIIEIGEFIETDPEDVWLFIRKWGKHPNEDLRTAIATCLLEHLLEYHFKEFFPKVREACHQSKRFANTFTMCSQFRQSEIGENSKAFIELQNRLD